MTYDPAARRAVAALARQLEEIKDSIRNGTSRPQLGTSSIEDGAITEYNIDGTLKQTIGKQPDGTNTVAAHNGPPPPQPSVPGIEILSGAVRVSWDGLWVGGAVTPMDFSRIDVHFIDDLSDDPLEMPARASILSQGWGDAALPLIPGTYRAVLVAWTQSGKFTTSDPSEEFIVLSVAEGIFPITETDIADDAISTPKLQANSITALQIAAGAVLADAISAGAITADKLSAIMTLSTLFRTAEDGARSEWDTDSLRFYDTLNNLRTRISGDDTFIDGSAHLSQLETDSATLGGETLGPPGGRLKLGAAILDAPTLSLEHAAEPISLIPLGGDPDGGPAFTDDDADFYWRWGPVIGGKQMLYRINPTTGAVVDGTLFAAPSPATSAGLKADGMVQVSAGPNPQVIRRARSGFAGATFTSPSTSAIIPAPGTGGYATGDPVIGTQRGTGHILLAHRVQGAQIIGGLGYSDGDIMVRRYTSSASGTVLTLSLDQRIRTGLTTSDPILSVTMDDVGGSFDLTPTAGYTAIAISVDGDVDGSGASHAIVGAANVGADVGTFNYPGPDRWSGLSKGSLWDGSSFIATGPAGDTLRKFGTGQVNEPGAWHTYTYWDGSNETEMAPPVQRPVYTRLRSKWSIPTLPAGVAQVRIYESLTSARDHFERVGTFVGTSGLPLSAAQDSIQPPSGVAINQPPAVSNFVNGSAYEIGDDLGNSWQAGVVKLRGLTQPHVAMTANAAQSIPTGASITTLTTLDTVVDASTRLDNGVDDDIAYNATTGEFTVRWPGVYMVSGNIRFAGDPNGIRAIYIQKNGVTMTVRQSGALTSSSYDASKAKQFHCDAGDKITIGAVQNSGGALSTVTTGTEVSITRISN